MKYESVQIGEVFERSSAIIEIYKLIDKLTLTVEEENIFNKWRNKRKVKRMDIIEHEECRPQVAQVHREYEGMTEDGGFEYNTVYFYNCEYCKDTKCEHWRKYNE